MIVVKAYLEVDVLLVDLGLFGLFAGRYIRGTRLNVPVLWLRCVSVDWERTVLGGWLFTFIFRDDSIPFIARALGESEELQQVEFPEFDEVRVTRCDEEELCTG